MGIVSHAFLYLGYNYKTIGKENKFFADCLRLPIIVRNNREWQGDYIIF